MKRGEISGKTVGDVRASQEWLHTALVQALDPRVCYRERRAGCCGLGGEINAGCTAALGLICFVGEPAFSLPLRTVLGGSVGFWRVGLLGSDRARIAFGAELA